MRSAKPSHPEITEKAFLEQVKGLARAYGWRWYHAFNSMRSTHGFPDLVLVRPPRLIFAELKTEKGELTPEQWAWMVDFEACSSEAYVWRPSDFEKIVEALKK